MELTPSLMHCQSLPLVQFRPLRVQSASVIAAGMWREEISIANRPTNCQVLCLLPGEGMPVYSEMKVYNGMTVLSVNFHSKLLGNLFNRPLIYWQKIG